MPLQESSVIQPWDSDHTALVHVLWAAGIKGEEADELAGRIMRSKWMRAVREHARAVRPAPGPRAPDLDEPEGSGPFGF